MEEGGIEEGGRRKREGQMEGERREGGKEGRRKREGEKEGKEGRRGRNYTQLFFWMCSLCSRDVKYFVLSSGFSVFAPNETN
jgi:hypothetical protein